MSKYHIRQLQIAELKEFFNRMEKDFASGEYPPMDVLSNHMSHGKQVGFVLCKGPDDLAYAFCVVSSSHRYVLLGHLAVFQEYRGQGIGTAFLEELHKIYKDKEAIIVEVERPEDGQTANEEVKRQRRIAFYEKQGYQLIKGIDYTIWDIPMHLMALPVISSMEMINTKIAEIMYQIYFELTGKQFIHKMKITERRMHMYQRQIKPGKKYRHFKGNEYLVLYLARHSETMEELVVYQALYGDYGIWVRPLQMFLEQVERNGRLLNRFEEID